MWKALSTHFGSTRSTLVLFALMAAVVMVKPAYWPLAVLIALLSLNLLVAVALHPAFRRQLPLLVAHLALLALVLAVAAGRLLSLDGRFELTQGELFEGTLLDRQAGSLHVDRLQRLAFRHEGFEIDYAPGLRRGATRNPVAWQDEDGRAQRAVIGDHLPLVLDGHRFYTTSNKGFAPLLRWEPVAGEPQRGAVHLPSYPVHELSQSRAWQLPDGREAWVMLRIDEMLIDPDAPARFRLPQQYRLVVRVGEQRAELQPGQALTLPGGRLVFEELRTWMGYRVAYDPALPWLLVSSLLSSLALAVHYLQRMLTQRRGAAMPRVGLADG